MPNYRCCLGGCNNNSYYPRNKLSIVCYNVAKIDGHRYSSSKDIWFLVCHVIKQDHLNQEKGQVTIEIGVPRGKSLPCQV